MVVEFLNLPQVQDLIGLAERTIRRMVREGKFPQPLRFGRTVRWSRRAVEDWIAARQANLPEMVTFNINAGSGSAVIVEARCRTEHSPGRWMAVFKTPDGRWQMEQWLTTIHRSLWDMPILLLCEDESIAELPISDALALLRGER